MDNNKSLLRHLYRNKRYFIDIYNKKILDKIINHKLISLINKIGVSSFSVFFSIKNEVDLKETVIYFTGKKEIFFPKIKKNMLFWRRFNSWNDGSENRYGIWEPNGPDIEKAGFDLMLIPGLSFDYKGFRIGYGGGYYDRSASDFKGIKIGACYDLQMINYIPRESYDIGVDMVLTEKKNIYVNKELFFVDNVMKRR